MNIEQIVEFARGGGMKAAPKKVATKPGAGSAVANVVGALAGGGCGNGTHQGKRGFQKGNKCAQGRNPNSAVGKASRAHQSARRAVSRHVAASTLHSAEGRASVRAAASAHRELQAARAAQKADRAGARKASSAVASGRASALPTKGTTPATPPAPAPKAAPSPKVKARVEKSLSEASKAKAERATQHLNDLQTGAAAGAFKPSDIHKHVERIGRGATKDELFHAAKAAGIAHEGVATKKALVEHLKQHAHSLSKPTPAAPAAMPIKDFAAKVVHAAHASPTGGVGDQKTMISHVKAHLDATDPAFKGMSEADFKAKLVEAHLGKHLELGRADLVESMHPGDVKASKTTHQNADFHFVRHPAAAAKAQSLSEQAKAHAPAKAEATAAKPKAAETSKPKAEPAKAAGGIPHDKLRATIKELHDGKIDDRQTNPAQVAQKLGVPKHEVEATLRELGAKGAISFDHASPEKVAMAKGYQTFPVDHEGKPYVGFRIDRPAKFEAATSGHAPEPAAKPAATPKTPESAAGAPKPKPTPKSEPPKPVPTPKAPPKSYTDVSTPVIQDPNARLDFHERIYARERKLHREYLDSLSPDEKGALRKYKLATDTTTGKATTAFYAVNSSLRNGGTHPLVPAIDSAIAKASVPRDTVVYRGIEDLRPYGFQSHHEAIGSTIHDKAFVSTSLSHQTAHQFSGGNYADDSPRRAIIRTVLPKGHKAAYVEPTNNLGENEYLLPRGSSFKITGHGGYTHEGVPILDAEVHHHEPKVGFAEDRADEAPPAKPDHDPAADRSDRFVWKPGDVTITRPEAKS